MFKTAVVGLSCIVLALSCAHLSKVQHNKQGAIPALHIVTDTGTFNLKISKLSVDVTVTGNIATTTFDITFYNDLNKILEGEFDFPLADGQQIARYALDMNGSLREGVVVEKATARIAFENTVRRGIDPGLVEKTKGNNFRTRIFPIPAKGYKRVIIATEQTLPYINKELFYQLLLTTGDTIGDFDLKTTVLKSKRQPVLENNELANFKFQQWQDAYVASYHAKDYTAQHTLAFTIPFTDNNYQVFTEKYQDKTYFYLNSPMPVDYRDKPTPSTIGIIWDVSGSGEKRNLQKEQELIKKYLSHFGKVQVSLVPFSVSVQPTEDFAITGGDVSSLLDRLKNIPFDGGTQLGAVDLSKYTCDEILLFTDGLSTLGKKELIPGHSPVMIINSSPSADYSCLKNIAQQTNGVFINLNELQLPDALKELTEQSYRFINFTFNENEVEELVRQQSATLNNGFSFAGILKQPAATVTANFGYGNEITNKRSFTVSSGDSNNCNQVKRAWASLKINQLDLQYSKNKDAITQLGKTFSIVTQNTSLIVLDRVEDYVEYEIVPPAELQKEYYALLKEKNKEKDDTKAIAFNEAVDAMKSLKKWYNSKYAHTKPKKAVSPDEALVDSAMVVMADTTVAAFLSIDQNAARRNNFTPPTSDLEAAKISTQHQDGFAENHITVPQGSDLQIVQVPDDRFDPDGSRGIKKDSIVIYKKEAEPGIVLNTWKPDAPYLKELEKVAADKRYTIYLSLKKQYANQPSFFVDVARLFLENKDKATAIRILSNVAELKLEDPELLRIVANQLLEMEEVDLAIELFKDILDMREEQPQACRDLASAYNEAGKYNEAITLLYKLILSQWDERFGDVKAIALNEMNAIISAHKNDVNKDSIDKQFIYPMPVDVRILIGWSSDNSDIDLWVTDPYAEKCYYEHNETRIGGKISRDVTQGYGPEEFCLRKAVNGNYQVDINLYGDRRQTLGGPITIRAELFTDYGKATQKRKTINFRVTSPKEVIHIGDLAF